MKINYKYKCLLKDNSYNFQRMEIILQVSDENKIDIYNQWSSLIINKNNGLYSAAAYDRNNNVQKYYIPETYFKEATLKELLPHDKPIILTKNSKCEYIEKINNKEFNFIINSDGKIIKMNFSGDSVLAYFKDINILYVYGDNKKDNYSSIQTSIYSNFMEKHIIMNGFGIFSEYNDFKDKYKDEIVLRKATFIPLKENLQELNFTNYNTSGSNTYDILPYYLRTYFICTDNKDNSKINTLNTKNINSPQDLFPNMLIPNKLDSKFVIFEIDTQKRFDDESIIISTEIIL